MNLDSVLDDLDSEDGNSTTEISNPEEARAETQKVVSLLEKLLLSDTGNNDDGGGAGDGSGSGSGGAGTNGGGNAGGGSGGGSTGSSGSSSGSSSGGTGSSGGSAGGSSGGNQGQQQSGAGQSQGDNGIPVTVAPTKPPMSQKEIQRAKVT